MRKELQLLFCSQPTHQEEPRKNNSGWDDRRPKRTAQSGGNQTELPHRRVLRKIADLFLMPAMYRQILLPVQELRQASKVFKMLLGRRRQLKYRAYLGRSQYLMIRHLFMINMPYNQSDSNVPEIPGGVCLHQAKWTAPADTLFISVAYRSARP